MDEFREQHTIIIKCLKSRKKIIFLKEKKKQTWTLISSETNQNIIPFLRLLYFTKMFLIQMGTKLIVKEHTIPTNEQWIFFYF